MHTLKKRELPSNILRYVLLLLGGAVSVMPMIYMISTSLKPNGALYEFPPKFFPALDTVTLENYVYIFSQEKFYVNFLNSAIVAILTVVIAAFVSSALAFCLARFRFPGRRALFGLVIGTMIIPGTTLIITQYQLASFFKLTNKLLGLVPFYVAWVIPFSTFMIKGRLHGRRQRFHCVLQGYLPAGQPGHRIRQHFQFPDSVGGIPVGADGSERHPEAHAAHRHIGLFRPASVHPVGLRLCHVRGEPDPRADHLHLLPEIFRFRLADRWYQRITNSVVTTAGGAVYTAHPPFLPKGAFHEALDSRPCCGANRQ